MKNINLFSPCVDDTDRSMVSEVLQGTSLTRGHQVEAFEQELAEYLGAKEVVCVNNASNGLNLLYKALRPECPGFIVTTPVTFVATATAAQLNGYQLKLFDEDPLSHDWTQIKSLAKPGDLLVPMHYGGNAGCVNDLLNTKNLIIEDACHAFGSVDKEGFHVGACRYSRASVFSFHPAKAITTLEGGAITTNDKKLAKHLRELRNNGIRRNTAGRYLSYDTIEPSLNAHMNEVSAALGRSQLKKIEVFKNKRFKLMQSYSNIFSEFDGVKFVHPEKRNCYHLATVLIDFDLFKITREQLMSDLSKRGIATNVHYIPLYSFECIKGFPKKDYPKIEHFHSQTLSLPLHCHLSSDDIVYICEQLFGCLKQV